MNEERKQLIIATVEDLVNGFLYYDRKEDEELPLGEIEKAIESGEITRYEIVSVFERELGEGLSEERKD